MNQTLNLGSPVLELDFVVPMVPGDEDGIEVQVKLAGRSSLALKLQGLKLAQTGSNDQFVVNKEKSFFAHFTFSFIDKEKGSSIPTPLQYRNRIEGYQARCDAFTLLVLQQAR